MKAKTIRTNDKCDKCSGFLIFEVKDEHYDKSGNMTQCGFWICTLCETARDGRLIRNYVTKATNIVMP